MPKQTNAATAGLMLLAAGEVPNFLAGMLPSLMTINRFAAEEVDRQALRRGEVMGAALALMVGFGASLAASNVLPFVATVIVLVIMLISYEHAIRNAGKNPNLTPINQQ
jgi:hypothetical protein